MAAFLGVSVQDVDPGRLRRESTEPESPIEARLRRLEGAVAQLRAEVRQLSQGIATGDREAHAVPDAEAGSRWLGVPETAARLGVGIKTVYAFIAEDGLPAYRFGRVIRLQRSDLDTWVKNQRIAPGQLQHLHSVPRTEEA